jgi:hypothetical protein
MALDEFLDVKFGHPQRGADREAAIPLDDECHRLSPGMDEMVNGDRHVQ